MTDLERYFTHDSSDHRACGSILVTQNLQGVWMATPADTEGPLCGSDGEVICGSGETLLDALADLDIEMDEG